MYDICSPYKLCSKAAIECTISPQMSQQMSYRPYAERPLSKFTGQTRLGAAAMQLTIDDPVYSGQLMWLSHLNSEPHSADSGSRCSKKLAKASLSCRSRKKASKNSEKTAWVQKWVSRFECNSHIDWLLQVGSSMVICTIAAHLSAPSTRSMLNLHMQGLW